LVDGAKEWLHGALDVAGLIPGFGEIADGVNALIYLAEGRFVEAGISAVGMIPILIIGIYRKRKVTCRSRIS